MAHRSTAGGTLTQNTLIVVGHVEIRKTIRRSLLRRLRRVTLADNLQAAKRPVSVHRQVRRPVAYTATCSRMNLASSSASEVPSPSSPASIPPRSSRDRF
ncbi:MAG: hypothetical protein JWL71_3930 [Acidobacteria bacterium]|nr:hypothetical protein [Acidobacteriota bacterium]